jgi:hypothetical protein
MKKKIIVEEYKAKTQEYLIALFYFPSALKHIEPTEPIKKALVSWFLDKEKYVADESYDLPSIKALGDELGFSNAKLSRQLKELYFDVYNLNMEKPLLFVKENEILCHLLFGHNGNSASFSVGLKLIPRKEESFNFFFIKPIIGYASFWVKQVYNEYDDFGQRVTLKLSMDYPNGYLNLLRDKAFLNREITFGELIKSEIEHELQERLLIQNRNGL